MATNKTINNITEDVIDVAEQVAESIPVKADNKFGVIGAVVVLGGVTIAGIAMGIRYIKKKKAEKEQADFVDVDNVQVVKDDFEECDSANK